MNKKCPYCGFINFVGAEACRKCETVLTELPHESSAYDRPPVYRGGVSSDRQPYKTGSSFTLSRLVLCIAGLLTGSIFYVVAIRPHVVGFVLTDKCVWTEFRPAGTDLTVMMPSKPRKPDPGDLSQLQSWQRNLLDHAFQSEVEGQGVAGFTFFDFPEPQDMNKSEQLLNTAVDGTLTKTESTLISKRLITYYGMAGMEFECVPPPKTFGKPGRAYGKFFVNSNRLYTFFIVGVEDSELLAGKDKFLNPQLGWVR